MCGVCVGEYAAPTYTDLRRAFPNADFSDELTYIAVAGVLRMSESGFHRRATPERHLKDAFEIKKIKPAEQRMDRSFSTYADTWLVTAYGYRM